MGRRVTTGLGGLAIAAASLAAAGVVFFLGLLTGWWWLLGALAAFVVLAAGSLAVGAAGASGRPTEPVARLVSRGMAVAFVVFTVAGVVLRYGVF